MYLRLQDNSIRFRISKIEAQQLVDGTQLRQSTRLSIEQIIRYSIVCVRDDSSLSYQQSSMHLSLKINKQDLIEELAERPTKLGIRFEQSLDRYNQIISLEINIKKTRAS